MTIDNMFYGDLAGLFCLLFVWLLWFFGSLIWHFISAAGVESEEAGWTESEDVREKDEVVDV